MNNTFIVVNCDPEEDRCTRSIHYHLADASEGESINMKDVSDGHHTFADLYEHRMALTIALARSGVAKVWRSKQHHPDDGPMFDDMFIVSIDLYAGPIQYHYNLKFWDLFDGIREYPYADKWDGEGPDKTIERLLNYRKGVYVF